MNQQPNLYPSSPPSWPLRPMTPAPAPPSPRRRGQRAAVIGLGCLAVAAMASVVLGVVGVGSSDAPDATMALRAAQKGVASASSVQFEGTTDEAWTYGVSGGPGGSTSYRSRIEGESAGPESWHAIVDYGDGADEAVRDGEWLYGRSAFDRRDLDAELWYRIEAFDERDLEAIAESVIGPLDGTAIDEYDISGASMAVGPLAIDPTLVPAGLADLLDRAHDAELTTGRGDEPDVLRFTVEATEQADELTVGALPDPRVELSIGADGMPTRLQLEVEDSDLRYEADISFLAWNEPVRITVPDEEDIDETPWIDEEALDDAAQTVTAVKPQTVPDGFELEYLDGARPEDTAEGCAQITIGYVEGDEFENRLDVYLLPLDCARRYDRTPFEPGPFGEVPVREGEFGWEVLIDETVVQLDTSLADDDLAAVVASLAPFDLDIEVARLNRVMEDRWGG